MSNVSGNEREDNVVTGASHLRLGVNRDSSRARQMPHEPLIVAEPSMPQTVHSLTTSTPTIFRPAKKRVHSLDDLKRFLESNSAKEFIGFILSLGEAVKGVKLSDEVYTSETVHKILQLLTTLSNWIDEIPPLPQTMRYGNIAYRDWYDKLEFSTQLLDDILGDEFKSANLELVPYLYDSFGNKSRIDYGTGHETNFVAFLFCLAKLGLLGEQDRIAIVTRILKSYVELMRKLQTTYWLEPAGSHGVWGLDDYQFLPFLLGASQLINHPSLVPASILEESAVVANEPHFHFFACVSFVKKVKCGPLSETSPYLYDISRVPSWSKVYTGLIKMYHAEVFSKFPIMQHFLFGRLISFPE